jgi:ribosomal protein L4
MTKEQIIEAVKTMTVLDVLNYDILIMTKAAVEKVEEVIA